MENLIKFCNEHKYICLFGTGEYAKLVERFLTINKIIVKGFIVSDDYKKKSEYKYLERSVHTYLEWEKLLGDFGVVLSIHPKYYSGLSSMVVEKSYKMNLNLYNEILRKVDNLDVIIEEEVNISNSKFGRRVKLYKKSTIVNSAIDDYSYLGHHSRIYNVHIGKFCSISPFLKAGLGRHPSREFVSTSPMFYSLLKQNGHTFSNQSYFEESLPIEIGSDVWIGSNVILLDGVKIGDGSIIAAGAVVSKNVPSYAVVGGVPAKIIRYRFEKEDIDFLLKDRWWDKPEKWLRENYYLFHNIKSYQKYCLKEK